VHQGGPGSSSIWLWLRAHLLRPSGSPCLRPASTFHVAFAGAPCGPPTSPILLLHAQASTSCKAKLHASRILRPRSRPSCPTVSAAASVRISAPTGTAPTSFPLTRTGCRTCTFWSHLLYYIHWAASPPLRSSGGATKAIFICSSHTCGIYAWAPPTLSCHQIPIT
jgi:hypothetical protein